MLPARGCIRVATTHYCMSARASCGCLPYHLPKLTHTVDAANHTPACCLRRLLLCMSAQHTRAWPKLIVCCGSCCCCSVRLRRISARKPPPRRATSCSSQAAKEASFFKGRISALLAYGRALHGSEVAALHAHYRPRW